MSERDPIPTTAERDAVPWYQVFAVSAVLALVLFLAGLWIIERFDPPVEPEPDPTTAADVRLADSLDAAQAEAAALRDSLELAAAARDYAERRHVIAARELAVERARRQREAAEARVADHLRAGAESIAADLDAALDSLFAP